MSLPTNFSTIQHVLNDVNFQLNNSAVRKYCWSNIPLCLTTTIKALFDNFIIHAAYISSYLIRSTICWGAVKSPAKLIFLEAQSFFREEIALIICIVSNLIYPPLTDNIIKKIILKNDPTQYQQNGLKPEFLRALTPVEMKIMNVFNASICLITGLPLLFSDLLTRIILLRFDSSFTVPIYKIWKDLSEPDSRRSSFLLNASQGPNYSTTAVFNTEEE